MAHSTRQKLVRSSLWLPILSLTLLSIKQLACAQELPASYLPVTPPNPIGTLSAPLDVSAGVQVTNPAPTTLNNNSVDVALQKYEEFKRTPYFVNLYDPKVMLMPEVQKEFIKSMIPGDKALYKEILNEAIQNKDKFAPNLSLMFKYSGKLIGRFIKRRREENKLAEHIEPKPSFFEYIASILERIINMSENIKKERGYSKKTVDTDRLYRRFDALLNYTTTVVAVSPVAGYIRWDEMVLFRDEGPANEKALIDEVADLLAQFRGLGYEKCIFIARKIVSLQRVFVRGFMKR